MIVATSSVYELLAGVSGALIVVIVALGIGLARTREKVAKLEEWARLYEWYNPINGKRRERDE
jgi:hypothetical protein